MGFMDSMRGFAEKVGDKVEKGAKSVSDNSKKIAEKTKVKKEISMLENEINSAYSSIGKLYFEANSSNPDADFADLMSDITTKTDRVEKFRQLLASLDDKYTCKQCGAELTKVQKFCDKCGTKVEPIVPPQIEGYNTPATSSQPFPNPIEQNAETVAETPVQNEQPVQNNQVVQEAAPAVKTCPNCGTELLPDQHFCEQCGTKI